MSDIKNKIIKIAGFSSKVREFKNGTKATQYTYEEGLEGGKVVKYNFYEKKQDGSNSKAFSDMATLRPMIGDSIEIGYTEEPYSFVGTEGNNVNAVARKIISIRKPE